MADLKRLEKALDKARSARERHLAFENLAEYYFNLRDFAVALDYYKDELKAAEELNDEHKIAKAHRMISEAKSELCKYEEALKHLKLFYAYARAKPNRLVEQQRALTTLGRTYFLMGESFCKKDAHKCRDVYNEAKDYFIQSLLLCEKLEKQSSVNNMEIQEMRARSMLNLGLVHESLGDLSKAIEKIQLAIRVCQKNELWPTLRLCQSSLGCVLTKENRIPEALIQFNDAINSTKSLPEPDRTHARCEVLIAQSEAYLKSDDIHSARKVLQRAYHLKTSIEDQKKDIQERLRTVAAMDLAQKRLQQEELDAAQKSKLFETLGDGFSGRRMYSLALLNYDKMLEMCKLADLDTKPCLVSLAKTCKDLHRYDDAISYFEQEMTFSTPFEACLSTLEIEKCQKKKDLPFSEREETLEKALALAVKADSVKLKHMVLQKLEKRLNTAGLHDKADDIKHKLELLGYVESEDESDEFENTPDIGDSIDLDDLSNCSDEEDDEEFDRDECSNNQINHSRPRRNPNRQLEAIKWRNEKGETKLHLACISGKTSAVRTLLEQGCDINAMDNAGWTPLHEACNHGHIEIAEILLDHGANINHKGGTRAGGVTPLHDAAAGGNFDVMNMLLDRKASVTTLTNEGDTPLETLYQYYERSGRSLPSDEEQMYSQVVNRLQTCLDKVGHPRKQTNSSRWSGNISDRSKNSPTYQEKKISPKAYVGSLRNRVETEIDECLSRKRSVRDVSPVSSSSSSPASSPLKEPLDHCEGQEGVSLYQSVMVGLRKNTSAPAEKQPGERKSHQPLLAEDEVVDEWLEDDLRPTKRRRTLDPPPFSNSNSSCYKPLSLKKSNSSRLSLTGSCSSGRPSTGAESRYSTGSHDSDTRNVSIGSISGLLDSPEKTEMPPDLWGDMELDYSEKENRNSDNRVDLSDSLSNHSTDSVSKHRNPIRRQASLLSLGYTKKHSHVTPASFVAPSFHPSQPQPPTRINVRVEGRLLAVPVPSPDNSVAWLASEAANRFYKAAGYLPRLNIQTADGALFADDDPVSHLFGGDEVVGAVLSWNVPPITDRFKDACASAQIELDGELFSIMEASQATQVIDMKNLVLPSSILHPVFKAIAMEHSLMKLNFANNYMRDEGLIDLCDHIGRLVNLIELDITGNGITIYGLSQLVKCAEDGKLKALRVLNLSHNDLQDCLASLSKLTAAIPLHSLAVADCNLTENLWDGQSHHLTLATVKSLDLSYNQLHAKGLAGFLGLTDHNEQRRLKPENVIKMLLVSLGGSHLCQEVALFFERSDTVAIQELHLSYPSMQDEDLSHLIRGLQKARHLHILRLPAAPNITGHCVYQLLMRQPTLHVLEVHGCKQMWSNIKSDELRDAVLAAARGMKNLTLRGAPYEVVEAWREAKGFSCEFKRGARGLVVLKEKISDS